MNSDWSPDDAQGSPRENKLTEKYFQDKGGLVVTEFNVTDGVESSRQRRLDAIRFPDKKDEIIEHKDIERDKINSLLRDHEVEVIEVHDWGFYVFGQLVGKEEVLQENWKVKETKKVLLVDNEASGGGSYYPKKRRDKATHEIFDKYNIEVVNL